jgi:hypothetical protein
MLDPQREILALVDNFVADLSDLAKRIAIAQLKTAFGVGAPSVVSSPPPAPTPQRQGRARRGQREIEALRDKLLAAISEQPGCRAEDINTALGTKTLQIAQPLRRLVEDQLVRTEGARRGMRYFVVVPAELQNGRRAAPEAAAAVDEPPA